VNRQLIKKYLPRSARSWLLDRYRRNQPGYYPRRSWSQAGEDLLLLDLLELASDRGFYVDVGAFHPRFGSNTYALYRRGWRGINIDARPGSMAQFRRDRPRDTNLEFGVGTNVARSEFFEFVEDELSTLDEERASALIGTGHVLLRKIEIDLRPLANVLTDFHVSPNFELLSVDCEGRDLDVLRSNDWRRFRPKTIIAECADGDLHEGLHSPVAELLRLEGYFPVAATRLNLIFRHASASKESPDP